MRLRGFILAILAMAVGLLAAQAPAQAGAERVQALFRQWLERDLWPDARRKGISRQVFTAAFRDARVNLRLPDLVLPGQKARIPRHQRQAEFRSPGRYFRESSLKALAARGRRLLARHKGLLARIEARFGVPGRIVLAIWGRETSFGRVKLRYNAFSILGTHAFLSRRKAFFRPQLIDALVIVQRGLASVAQMKSSWGGALGQPQMLPGVYLKYAVDFDGDGRRNIWTSIPDILASIASHLARHGWQRGRDWGFEVRLPASVSCALEGPDQGKTFARWAALGVRRVNGRPFPQAELRKRAFLLLPAGRHGPAFLATRNFYVLKSYNKSDLYALFIGHLADRIQWGDRRFAAPWGKVGGMYRSDVATLQRALERQGFDVGGADGLPGFKTRRSIGAWQKAHGLRDSCFPEKSLLGRIR